ncbi:uncharacterized protein LOC134841090 [Symsagittifera roscoffensis]|uniref:uncharacterized protein LOC134841090 n=1 Tax=Symsagittifera roscoffensis TaxID=84072 RepID=UPI00307C2382
MRYLIFYVFAIIATISPAVASWRSHITEEDDEDKWESLIFTIPNAVTPTGRSCAHFNGFYCLEAYATDEGWDDEENEMSAWERERLKIQFTSLTAPMFRSINFFVNPTTIANCCDRQNHIYIKHGLKRLQLSPEQYLDKLTDYRDQGKHLNYIKAKYSSLCNVNFILEIGFGRGHFKVDSSFPTQAMSPFMFPMFTDVPTQFNYGNPGDRLTFRWFKHHIMCRGQPWICQVERRARAVVRSDFRVIRRPPSMPELQRRMP